MALTRTRFIQSNTSLAKIQDPITVLNSAATNPTSDVGFLINRDLGSSSNVAIFWNETNDEFVLGFTTNTGLTDSNVTVSSYAPIRTSGIYANIAGGTTLSNVYLTGSLIPTSNIGQDLGTVTNRYRDLWIETLRLNSQSASISSGNWILTTGGSNVTLGQTSIFQNLTVTSNLTVQGNTFLVNSQNLTVSDSIIDLHTFANLAPLTSDDGRDIGLKFHYYKTDDNIAFLGWANDTGYLEWYDSGQESGNVFSGNTYGTIKAGELLLANSTVSTTSATGALRVTGGAGIGGVLNVGGNIVATASTASNSTTTGALVVVGGLGVGGTIYGGSGMTVGGNDITFNNAGTNINLGTSQTTGTFIVGGTTQTGAITVGRSTNTQVLTIAGGVTASGSTKQIYFGANGASGSQTNIIAGPTVGTGNLFVQAGTWAFISNTAASTTRASGALVVSGGVGVGGTVSANVVQGLNSAGTAGTAPEFRVVNGNQALNIIANTAPGSYNASTAAYDTLIYFTQGSANTGNLLIAPWAAYASGIRISSTGRVTVTNAQTSTSTTTGAFVVSGGAGIAGNVYADRFYTTAGLYWSGNGVAFSGATPAGTTGFVQYNNNGSLGAAGLYYDVATGNVVANATTASTSITSGAFVVKGGLGVAGNIFAGGINGTIYGSLFLGTTAVNYNRSSSSLLLNGVGIDGTATTATNAINTGITSNVSAGTAYISFVSTTSGNAAQSVNTALTYNPNSGNLRAYGLLTDTGVFWASNGAAYSSGSGGGTYTASSTAPVSPENGDFWYDTSTDILYQYSYDGVGNYWLDIQTLTIAATSGASPAGGTISGNLIPSANVTYSLGSSDYRWKDLWLAGNTIYIGDVSISSTGGVINLPAGSTVGGSAIGSGSGTTFIRRNDWVGNYSYCGSAPEGTAESTAAWDIVRIQISGSGAITSTTRANSVAWANRVNATYS